MKIYLIRHGEKEHEGFDTKLTENGRLQIEKIAKSIQNKQIKQVYTSTNPRSLETAEIINKYLAIPLKKIENLKELPKEVFFLPQSQWSKEDKMIINQIRKFLISLEKNNEDILLSMHAGINRAILSNILDIPLEKTIVFTQDIACLNILEFKEIYGQKRWCINLLNSTHHLQ
jgi:probable phosphoglycerate mutase